MSGNEISLLQLVMKDDLIRKGNNQIKTKNLNYWALLRKGNNHNETTRLNPERYCTWP
jgi:hypothetical protein